MGCRKAPFLVDQFFAYVKRVKNMSKKLCNGFFFKQLQNGYNNKKR